MLFVVDVFYQINVRFDAKHLHDICVLYGTVEFTLNNSMNTDSIDEKKMPLSHLIYHVFT
jgi:hypothetical protein